MSSSSKSNGSSGEKLWVEGIAKNTRGSVRFWMSTRTSSTASTATCGSSRKEGRRGERWILLPRASCESASVDGDEHRGAFLPQRGDPHRRERVFTGLHWHAKKAVMDHTFLSRSFKAIRAQTWEHVNRILGQVSVEAGQIDPAIVRTDTTVVETNIHWPSDSSLLWDVWCVAPRIMSRGRKVARDSCPDRFHSKKVKKLHLYITRYSSNSKKTAARGPGHLSHAGRRGGVGRANRRTILPIRPNFRFADTDRLRAGVGVVPTGHAAGGRAVGSPIQRRNGVCGRVCLQHLRSHAELINRRRRHKLVEFGHGILVCQTPQKFITDYEVYEHRPADCELTEMVIDRPGPGL